MDELSLVRRCARGEEEAWDELVASYSSCIRASVRNTLAKYLRDYRQEEAEDAYSEVLALLLEDGCRRLRKFEGRNGSSLSTYLWVVASRTALDYIRKERRPTVVVEGDGDAALDVPDGRELPVEAMERRQMERQAARVVAGLSDNDRLFVKLHYVDGLSTEEVAALLGVSVGTVYSKKNRIREKMREIFRKEFPGTPVS